MAFVELILDEKVHLRVSNQVNYWKKKRKKQNLSWKASVIVTVLNGC